MSIQLPSHIWCWAKGRLRWAGHEQILSCYLIASLGKEARVPWRVPLCAQSVGPCACPASAILRGPPSRLAEGEEVWATGQSCAPSGSWEGLWNQQLGHLHGENRRWSVMIENFSMQTCLKNTDPKSQASAGPTAVTGILQN